MKRFAFLAVGACLWGCALSGPGRADFIYDFVTTTPASGGGGSVRVTIDVPDAQVAMGGFDASNITSLHFALTGTSSPFFDFSDTDKMDLTAAVLVNPTTGAFLGPTPDFFIQTGFPGSPQFESSGILPSPSSTGLTFSVAVVVAASTGVGDWTITTSTPTAVPEPASLTLLGLGSLGLVGYGWRRRKQAAA